VAIAAALCAAIPACTGDPAGLPRLNFGLPEEAYWADTRDPVPVGEGLVLVTNNLDDTVSLVALGDFTEVGRTPVGLIPVEREGPHHLAVDPAGDFYYVGISNYVPGSGSGPHGAHGTGTADGYVLKIRAADHLEVASVRVDRSPGDVRGTPDGRTILVSHFDLLRIAEVLGRGGDPAEMRTRLAIVDAATMTRRAMVPICPAAHGIAVSPDGRTAYVSCYDDRLAVVDLQGPEYRVTLVPVVEQPGPVSAPRCQPYAVTLSPGGDRVWVSCLESGDVLCYDVAAGAIDRHRATRLPGPALFGTFSPDGTTLIVPYQAAGGLAFLDAATGEVREDLRFTTGSCVNPHAVRFTPDGTRVIVVCEGDHVGPGALALVDPGSMRVERVVTVGRFPDDVQILRRPR
jgi:DNA-binding beta-propeller fold protein YncE